MNYNDMKNVKRTRIYRSMFPELPIEKWELVADMAGTGHRFNDDLANRPKVPHYYRAQYLFKDGKLSSLSDATVARNDLVHKRELARKAK